MPLTVTQPPFGSQALSGMAIANTLAMATTDRRRDFAVLRLTGASRAQILRVVAAEATIVVVIGGVIGTLTAVPAVFGIATWVARDFGLAARILFDWPAVAVATAGCLVMASAASLLTTASALRIPAVQAAGVTE